MQKTRVAVVGASGYSGEELVRLLLRHPGVEITCLTSRQYGGQPVGTVFPRYPEAPQKFMAPDMEAIAEQAEAAFLALPHGLATDVAIPLVDAGLKVVDISADFRLRDPEVYAAYYGAEHPAPELLGRAVYGLPERYRSQVRDARLVA